MLGDPRVCESCGESLVPGEVVNPNTVIMEKDKVAGKAERPTSPFMETWITCPECLHRNQIGALFCDQCARDLTGAGLVMEPGPAEGEEAHAVLYIEDAPEPIGIQSIGEMVMGRADEDSTTGPELDLSPFQGLEKGVSREHAVLRWQGDVLFVVDLGSTNGTFVNGNRLAEQQVWRLNHGDKIHLGKLALRISFTS
jgi:hypothetical protein